MSYEGTGMGDNEDEPKLGKMANALGFLVSFLLPSITSHNSESRQHRSFLMRNMFDMQMA